MEAFGDGGVVEADKYGGGLDRAVGGVEDGLREAVVTGEDGGGVGAEELFGGVGGVGGEPRWGVDDGGGSDGEEACDAFTAAAVVPGAGEDGDGGHTGHGRWRLPGDDLTGENAAEEAVDADAVDAEGVGWGGAVVEEQGGSGGRDGQLPHDRESARTGVGGGSGTQGHGDAGAGEAESQHGDEPVAEAAGAFGAGGEVEVNAGEVLGVTGDEGAGGGPAFEVTVCGEFAKEAVGGLVADTVLLGDSAGGEEAVAGAVEAVLEAC